MNNFHPKSPARGRPPTWSCLGSFLFVFSLKKRPEREPKPTPERTLGGPKKQSKIGPEKGAKMDPKSIANWTPNRTKIIKESTSATVPLSAGSPRRSLRAPRLGRTPKCTKTDPKKRQTGAPGLPKRCKMDSQTVPCGLPGVSKRIALDPGAIPGAPTRSENQMGI